MYDAEKLNSSKRPPIRNLRTRLRTHLRMVQCVRVRGGQKKTDPRQKQLATLVS